MDDEPDARPPENALTECKQKIEQLEEENAQLRNAAETFGDLAERLNAEVRAEKGLPPTVGIAKDEKSSKS